ncbi:MAG: hypothetical protein NZ772_05200, partial [Cyanobacteria bacterium]|nr:hypothetical protein [Cyanobacteriota bacterium]
MNWFRPWSMLVTTTTVWAALTVPSQSQLSMCQPPNPGEYLLLVVSQTPEAQAQVKRALPANASSSVCQYLDTIITRVEGFTNLDIANAWAAYVTDVSGLPAFVVQPASTVATSPIVPSPTVPSTQPSPVVTPIDRQPQPTQARPTQPAPAPLPYNPKLLGSGFAVLVDYNNRPEIASQLRQILGRDIGFVSYEQRPYLLANHTPAQGTANATQRVLRD